MASKNPDDYCQRCGAELFIGSWPFCHGDPSEHGTTHAKTALFPFEARHITPDGKPIIIESMKHLRDVERHHGVVLSAFSKDNIRDVDPIKNPPRYRQEELEARKGYKS